MSQKQQETPQELELKMRCNEYARQIEDLEQRKTVYRYECQILQKKIHKKLCDIEKLKEEAVQIQLQLAASLDQIAQMKCELQEKDVQEARMRQELELELQKKAEQFRAQEMQAHLQLTVFLDQIVQLKIQLQEKDMREVQMRQELDVKTQQILEQSRIQKELGTELWKVKEENHMLSEFQSQYSTVFFATWLIPIWRSYLYEHYEEIKDKKKFLKINLDKESEHIIDLLCLRNFEILPQKRDEDNFLYHKTALYEPWELEGLKHTGFKYEFARRHSIPKDCYLETTVAEFYNGLKLLPERVQARLRNSHIIDGGAYWGDSMLAFSEYGPETIHCFEPDPDNFGQLQKTVQRNKLEDMILLNPFGLSNSTHEELLYAVGEYSSCSTTLDKLLENINGREKGKVHLLSIDEYTDAKKISVGMIKLDIEGAEFDAIQGAKKTILRDKPILLISIYHTPRDFFEIKPLIESWGLPYNFLIRKTTYRDLIAEVMLIGYVDQ